MSAFLTKALFMGGLQCHKQLWLQVNAPHRSLPPTPAQQRIIDQGEQVGAYARQQFPNGQLIQGSGEAAVLATQTAIATGISCLFEATFCFEDILVRCDILQKVSAIAWELIEVKSSRAVKDEHYWDVAIQKYVLTGAGIPIAATKLMYINNQSCYYPDLSNLFAVEEITEMVDARLEEVAQKLHQFRAILAEPLEPVLAIGKHCETPNPCPFTADCWQSVPELSIFTIPRLDWKKKEALIAQELLAIADLPPTYKLTDNQQAYVESIRTHQPSIDPGAIAAKLAELDYPIHFLDFETQNPAIPRCTGLKPYESFPFQYSCHILHDSDTIDHRDYLHIDGFDPRPSLIAALVRDIATTGSVVVYHKSFEASVLQKLARDFPEFASQLQSICDRLWDLEEIFKKHYQHPGFRGSTSIKKVLPVLVPHLNYQSLAVYQGDQAQAVWEELLNCPDETQKTILIDNLRAYCHMDTLAMVEIYQVLRSIGYGVL